MENGSYYYLHTYYKDALYRDLGDIIVVKGQNDMLMTDFKWDINEEYTPTTNNNTSNVQNPDTGIITIGSVIIMTLVAAGSYLVIKRKQNNY